VIQGNTATFTVTANGTQPFTYTWKKNGAVIAGATGPSYTTPATVPADNNSHYKVNVKNSLGAVDSVDATLTVIIAPTIQTQPQNKTINVGQAVDFNVTAQGTNPLSYQWQRNGVNISGATANVYHLAKAVAGDNGATFRVLVTNAAGTATSNNATLTVH
jgi:Immunoglobulin I-set domain